MVAPPDQFHYNEWNDPFARCLSVDFYSLEVYLDDSFKVLEPYYPEDYEGYEEEPETWEQEEAEAEAATEDKEIDAKATEPPSSKKELEVQPLPKVSTPPTASAAARVDLSSGAPTVPVSSPKLTRTESVPSVSKEPDASPTASEQKRMKSMGGDKLQQLRAKIAELKLKKEKEAQKDQSMKKKEKSKSSPPAEENVHRRSASPPARGGQSEPAPKRHKGEGAKRQRSNGENQKSIDNVPSKRSGRGEPNSSPKRSTSKRPSPKRKSSPKRQSPKRPRGEATLLPKRRVSEASPPNEVPPTKRHPRIESAAPREKEELILKRHRSDVSMTKLVEEKRHTANESPRVQLRAAATPRQEGAIPAGLATKGDDLLRRVLRSRASPQDVVRNALAPSKSRRV